MIRLNLRRINFSKWFYNDKMVMLIATIISFSIWVVVAVNDVQTRPVTISDIPIEVSLSDSAQRDGLRVFGGKSLTGEIAITGNRIAVGQVTKSDIRISALQSNNITLPGNYTLELTAQKINSSSNYEFYSSVTPKFVTVMVDRYREVEFNIEDGISYRADANYFASSTSFSSSKVIISGPETEVSKVSKIVAQGSIEGVINSTQTITVPLVIYDSYGDVINSDNLVLSETEVSATVPILLKKELPIEVELTNKPSGLTISNEQMVISQKTIQIAAPNETLNNMNSVKLKPLDFSRIDRSINNFNLQVNLPAECKNLSNLYSVGVKIDLRSMKSKTISVTQLSPINIPNGKLSKITNYSIPVKVIGPASEISTLKEADVSADVDLKGKEEFTGHTEIVAKFKVNKPSCWVYGEYKANVSIWNK